MPTCLPEEMRAYHARAGTTKSFKLLPILLRLSFLPRTGRCSGGPQSIDFSGNVTLCFELRPLTAT